ncbi:MAG: hypothetical protein MI864_25935 [Pseudomonadales bacterium]|nr:hypothetical protein [Pseudomonadales bacterium]
MNDVIKEEKRLYREARKEYAIVYILALFIIVGGFYLTEPFSFASMIPSAVLMLWAAGIARRGSKEKNYLLSIEPEMERLKHSGLTEHEAMKQLGCDSFYYKPFWAVI